MKKIFAIALAALMLCALSVSVSAAETNYVFHDVVSGSNDYDGLTLDTPKKSWGTVEAGNTMAALMSAYGEEGVTVVVTGKARPGADYSLPAMAGPITITSLYNGMDFKNPMPPENPAGGVWKQAGGTTFTFNSDVTFENIILFSENPTQEALRISSGATITIADTVDIMTKPGSEHYFKLVIDEGCTAKLSASALELLTIENNGTLLDLSGNPATIPEKTEAPVETTVAPAETTAAPAETTAAPVETTVAPAETTAAPVETTAAPTAPAVEEGANIGLIIGIVAAVIVVAAIVIVVVKKKKN